MYERSLTGQLAQLLIKELLLLIENSTAIQLILLLYLRPASLMMVKSKSMVVVVALHSMGKVEMQVNKESGVGFAVQMNLVSRISKLPHGLI